jgi:phosphatidylserine/phosphatidylglycerophosphate/cardiolipin synthase-like enzyme
MHEHASEIEQRFPRLQTISWSRATAIIKASTGRAPRASSNHQVNKPVPSRLVIYLLLALLLFCAPYVLAAEITVCFTPEYGMTPSCTQEVVDALAGAKKSVLVQAYSFTSAPIAKALVDAHRRGVDVKVILDRSNRTAHYSAATFLAHADIPVWIDASHAIAHNKIMIIDDDTILTGSFNFTKAAEQQNAENLLTIRDSTLAEQYTANWHKHLEHSEPYAGGATASASSAQRTAAAEEPLPTHHGAVRGNKRSHIYQWPGCSSYDTISPQNRVEFPSAQAAEAAGYRPAHNYP